MIIIYMDKSEPLGNNDIQIEHQYDGIHFNLHIWVLGAVSMSMNLDNVVPFLFGINFLFLGCHALMKHFRLENFNPQYQMFSWSVLYWGAGLVLAAAYPYPLFGWVANTLDIIGSWFMFMWSKSIDGNQKRLFVDQSIISQPGMAYKFTIIITPIVSTIIWFMAFYGLYETKLLTATTTQLVGSFTYDAIFSAGTSFLCLLAGIVALQQYACVKGRMLAMSLIIFWFSDAVQPIYQLTNSPYDAETLLWFIEWASAVAGLALFNFAYFLRYDC